MYKQFTTGYTMPMLNLFPIMFLSLLAHAILRITAGMLLIYLGVSRQKTLRTNPAASWGILAFLSLIEIVVGAMLIAGFLTQVAALILLCYAIVALLLRKRLAAYLLPPSAHVLMIGVAISLFITGAGAFAFDMPF